MEFCDVCVEFVLQFQLEILLLMFSVLAFFFFHFAASEWVKSTNKLNHGRWCHSSVLDAKTNKVYTFGGTDQCPSASRGVSSPFVQKKYGVRKHDYGIVELTETLGLECVDGNPCPTLSLPVS